jgi:hypothetical protein
MMKPFLAASGAIAFLMMAGPVITDEAKMKKYRNYLPEQIWALPEKVRDSDVPMAYLMAAQGANTEVARIIYASMLNRLMYHGMSNYGAAVRAFQKDVGDAQTGKLTVWQIWQLQQKSEMQRVEPPLIPGFFSDIKSRGYAKLEGTLQMLDEKPAFPVNKVKIMCVQHEGSCTLDEIDVQFPTEKDWAAGFTIYWTDPTEYKITKWTGDVIEADYEASGALAKPCRNTKLQLNFKAKEST